MDYYPNPCSSHIASATHGIDVFVLCLSRGVEGGFVRVNELNAAGKVLGVAEAFVYRYTMPKQAGIAEFLDGPTQIWSSVRDLDSLFIVSLTVGINFGTS